MIASQLCCMQRQLRASRKSKAFIRLRPGDLLFKSNGCLLLLADLKPAGPMNEPRQGKWGSRIPKLPRQASLIGRCFKRDFMAL